MQKRFITFIAVLFVFLSWSISHASTQANSSERVLSVETKTNDIYWGDPLKIVYSQSGLWEPPTLSQSSIYGYDYGTQLAGLGSSATATQTSNILENDKGLVISAKGSVSTWIDNGTVVDGGADLNIGAYASAASYLDYDFIVSNLMNYKIEYAKSGNMSSISLVESKNESPFVVQTIFKYDSTADIVGGLYSGTLNPGRYSIAIGAWADGIAAMSGEFNVTFTASPVPIPGAAWLFGSGLIALLGYRKKYNN